MLVLVFNIYFDSHCNVIKMSYSAKKKYVDDMYYIFPSFLLAYVFTGHVSLYKNNYGSVVDVTNYLSIYYYNRLVDTYTCNYQTVIKYLHCRLMPLICSGFLFMSNVILCVRFPLYYVCILMQIVNITETFVYYAKAISSILCCFSCCNGCGILYFLSLIYYFIVFLDHTQKPKDEH